MKKIVIIILFLFICYYCYSQTYHSGTISNDEIWHAVDNPHICTDDILVSSSLKPTLNLEPGVLVKFDPGVKMTIGHGSSSLYAGGLKAVGNQSDPIIFTSNTATPASGDWGFIHYNNHCLDDSCRIEHAFIEYGGSATSDYGLRISNTPVIVKSVTFQYNAGCGIKINNFSDSQRPTIANCTFSENTEYPIEIYANDLMALGTGNTYSSNGTDEIYVYGDNVKDNQDWTSQGIPLYISFDIDIWTSGCVTVNILYGSVLKFEEGTRLYVGHGSSSLYLGCLNATGVQFLGSVDSLGHWKGLIFDNFTQGGTLSGCLIKNAGWGSSENRSVFFKTNSSCTQQTITGCQITNGKGDGVYLEDGARPMLSGNTISGNTDYPLSIYVNDVGCIGSNNDFTANGIDKIKVRNGSVDESQTWFNHGVPYELSNSITIYSSLDPHLKILPGCIIQLKDGDNIKIGHPSSGAYLGSLEAHDVIFTRAEIGNVHSGIIFDKYSVDTLCVLTDCIVEYGGYSDTYNAGIIITQSAPTLDHVTFRNNNKFGLRISDISEGTNKPTMKNCRFYNNGEHPINIYASELSCLKENNIYSGNNPDRIYVHGDYIEYDNEWINQGIPFEINGNITVSSSHHPHLIINSGIELLFNTDKYINIGHASSSIYRASMYANGVRFAGINPTPGDWQGIRFLNYTNDDDCELNKCHVEGADDNIYFTYSYGIVKDCIIRNAQNYGIYCRGSTANVSIYKCSIYNNDVGIHCNNNANPLIGGDTGNANSIINNASYGVQNISTSVTVDATYNWWGHATGPYNATTNPDGLGNPVSDYVDYGNYLTTPLSEAPSLFDLLSPAKGDTLWSFDSILDWETSIDPTPNDTVKYRLVLSTSSKDNYVVKETIDDISTSHFLLSESIINDDTRYWWQVTAYDLYGLETNCNQSDWYFDVFVIEPPDNFTLISPANQATVYETSVLLTWNAANDPDPGDDIYYTVYLDETASFSDPDSAVTLETGVYTPFCEPGNLFYWTVKATDSYGLSTYSGMRSFYVDPSAGPRPPSWITINKNGNDFDLTWEISPGSDSFTIEHSTDPYSGFTYLGTSDTNSYTHVSAAQTYTESYYRIIAIDNDLVLFWRDLSGNRLE